ncbi:MAG: hypothetical protein CUN55_19180, partial [Phototrophicales bacterium]
MKKNLLKLSRAAALAFLPLGMAITPHPALATTALYNQNLCVASMAPSLPNRRHDALSGSVFAQQIRGLSGIERDRAIEREIRAGNVPSFLRDLRPVTLTNNDGSIEITVCVTPDYLAIGSDRDFIRVPMGLNAAF